MQLYDGFSFTNFKDFRLYSTRKGVATALYSQLVALGYEPVVALDSVYWFVAGFCDNSNVVALCKHRSTLLADCGCLYPEDNHNVVNPYILQLDDISGKFNSRNALLQVRDESLFAPPKGSDLGKLFDFLDE